MASRRGFTVIELVIVILIGSILAGIVSLALAGTLQRTSLDQSRRMLETMVSRTRAQAIQEGERIELQLNSGANTVSVVRTSDGAVLETYDFREELDINLDVGGGNEVLCMGPNGVADFGCGTVPITGSLYPYSTPDETYAFTITAGGTII
ncbi:MAG TPA: prepilin-type N-terminal cleavage/methylation domain-containing protein [Longimicrobiales bacterium]|nr:prepilin-type N-terminal cleavage/methylation domain-containing protein [Longimicrobiales bacterium]